MAFSIDLRHTADAAVLVVSGRLTVGEPAAALHRSVEQQLAAGDKNLVLDMALVDYVDSSGLGAMVTALACARKRGGDLKLANIPQRIQDLLDVSSTYMLFQMIELAPATTGAE